MTTICYYKLLNGARCVQYVFDQAGDSPSALMLRRSLGPWTEAQNSLVECNAPMTFYLVPKCWDHTRKRFDTLVLHSLHVNIAVLRSAASRIKTLRRSVSLQRLIALLIIAILLSFMLHKLHNHRLPFLPPLPILGNSSKRREGTHQTFERSCELANGGELCYRGPH